MSEDVNWADADCHYGDHSWNGTSQCVNCYARLRCSCGVFVREDNLDRHMETCRWVARNFETQDTSTEVAS